MTQPWTYDTSSEFVYDQYDKNMTKFVACIKKIYRTQTIIRIRLVHLFLLCILFGSAIIIVTDHLMKITQVVTMTRTLSDQRMNLSMVALNRLPSKKPENLSRPAVEQVITFETTTIEPGTSDDILNDTNGTALQLPCTQPLGPAEDEMEDLMCLPRPETPSAIKNPCFAVRDSAGISEVKCMPYYFLIGVDKCGTTDFAHRLTLHPSILPNGAGGGKETYFWCWTRYGLTHTYDVPRQRFREYLNFFSSATSKILSTNGRWNDEQFIVGDATPMDFWDFRGWPRDPQNRGLTEPKVLTPHHIRHMFKDPKFILLFRDPVERLFSDYIFLKYGTSSEQFDYDVPIALEMMNSCLKVNSTRQCFFSNDMYHKLPMRLHVSCYSVFLREWLSVFDKEQFFIARTEDYHDDPQNVLQDAFAFLGLETLSDDQMTEIVEEDILNETVKKEEAGIMADETRDLLEEFYAPYNKELVLLLDDDRFSW